MPIDAAMRHLSGRTAERRDQQGGLARLCRGRPSHRDCAGEARSGAVSQRGAGESASEKVADFRECIGCCLRPQPMLSRQRWARRCSIVGKRTGVAHLILHHPSSHGLPRKAKPIFPGPPIRGCSPRIGKGREWEHAHPPCGSVGACQRKRAGARGGHRRVRDERARPDRE
jgi:hypothetical protein